MNERCEYKSKQGVCGSPVYASKTTKILENGQWIKRVVYVCEYHAHRRRTNQKIDVKEGERKYSGERSPYRDWLSKNGFTDEDGNTLEHQLASPEHVTDADMPWYAPELDLDMSITADRIKGFADKELTPRQKEVYVLFFFEGRTQDEIAIQLRLKQQVVSKHLKRIIKKLSSMGVETGILDHKVGGNRGI